MSFFFFNVTTSIFIITYVNNAGLGGLQSQPHERPESAS